MDIVPLQTKEHAQHVVDYLNENNIGKECVAFLQENILNKKHQSQVAVADPDVVVTFEFDGRYGSFTASRMVTLKDYLVIMAINPTLYFNDMVGKYSEVKCEASDFSVRWATDNDNDLDEWNAMEEGCSDHSDTIMDKLWKKADALLKKNGPFSDESDLHVIREMVSNMQKTFLSLRANASFPVNVLFKNVYESGELDIWTKKLPKKGYMTPLRLVFGSPQEAAATILKRPEVTIKRGQPSWSHYQALKDEVVSLENKEYSCEQLKDQTRDDVSNDFSLKRTRSWEDLLKEIQEHTQPRTDLKVCLSVGERVLKKGKKE